MNLKSLLFFAGFVAILLSSCSKDEESVAATGLSLDQTTLEIPVDSSIALIATIEPEGASGTIEWSSSDPSVAAVTNGVVTALKTGEATVVALLGDFSATCQVTVTSKQMGPGDAAEVLKGSDYFIIQMDALTRELIADKVVGDMSPDNEPGSKNLYIWESTFTGGNSIGTNYFGQAEGWISLIVGNVGWSGAGYSVGPEYPDIDMTKLFENPEDYYFHIALKSAQPSSSYLFIFSDGVSEAKVCIGSQAYDDAGSIYAPYVDFPRDNEWHGIEIPVTHLNSLGLFFNEPISDANVLAWLAGGTAGTTFDMDAAFYYKKAK